LLSSSHANSYENNVGVEFPQQLMYVPMYALYGGLSAIFLPFSKETYKNSLENIVMDFDSGVNFDPTGSPYFFLIPQCKNNLLILIVGFAGRESELMKSDSGFLVNNYEVKKEDLYLKDGRKIIRLNSIFIAGTEFDKISSRFAEISYPLGRKKKRLYRFVEYPYSCNKLDEKDVGIIISKIYQGDKVIKRDINFDSIKFGSQPYRFMLK
jgi:hypothetical protein